MKEDMDNTQKNVVDKLMEVKSHRNEMDSEFGGMKSTFTSELATMKQLITDTLSSIERESSQMKMTIAEETAAMKQLITDTLSSIEELESTKMKTTIATETASMKQLITESLSSHEEAMKKQLKETSVIPPVAFSSKTITSLSMSDGKVLVFSSIIHNCNGAYDKNTGIFTVPVAGIYQFTAQICTYSGQRSCYGFFKNEDFQTSSHIGDTDYYICSTLTALIDVQMSDRITVRCRSSCNGDRLFESADMQNIFSGFIVQLT